MYLKRTALIISSLDDRCCSTAVGRHILSLIFLVSRASNPKHASSASAVADMTTVSAHKMVTVPFTNPVDNFSRNQIILIQDMRPFYLMQWLPLLRLAILANVIASMPLTFKKWQEMNIIRNESITIRCTTSWQCHLDRVQSCNQIILA